MDVDLGKDRENVEVVDYSNEMKGSYVTYAMSVIVSRALPDVRDGLKPVHRRIMYGMEERYHSRAPYSKSARIVGDVMGKFHPHGNLAIYDAMVRLAQGWKLLHPLVDGQGNFGSRDDDPPAADRYTEARLTPLAQELVSDLGKNTVSFRPNYDGKELEPTVLPARFPHLLVNGQAGIAVGMATNIPTHNLREVVDAALLLMDRPDATVEDVLAVMPGPDFPTGGVIMGVQAIRSAFETGRGSLVVSGVAEVEQASRGRTRLVITELPYEVVKETYVSNLAKLVNAKTVEGISDIRDESDRKVPVRIVIDVKADADPGVVLNSLRRHTDFQKRFPVNATCLSSTGKPEVMGVVQMLREFVDFRRECVRKRTVHDLDKARDSQVRQIALYAATGDIDEVVRIIRNSPDVDSARVALMERTFDASEELVGFIREADPDATLESTFRLSYVQADAILALTLRRLTGLERDNIADELRTLAAEIKGLLAILREPSLLDGVIRDEMTKIRNVHGRDRLTRIETTEADEIDDESLVERRDVIVTLTKAGYVKRTDLGAYRAQRRGGKGKTGMDTKDDDFVVSTIVCTTRTPLLVFTDKGQVYSRKAYRLPDSPPNARGRYIGNFVDLREGEKVTALVPLPEDREHVEKMNLVFVTDFGTVRRNGARDFLDIKRSGKIAMKLDEAGGAGRLVAVLVADAGDDVLIATAQGMALRFAVDDVRVFQSRDSVGMRGITLKDRDKVVDATILVHSDAEVVERDAYLSGGHVFYRRSQLCNERGEMRPIPASMTLEPAPEEGKEDRLKLTMDPVRMEEMRAEERFLLTVTSSGFGKRSSTHEYRVSGRGGSGVTAATVTEQTGPMVSCLLADSGDGLVLVTDGGQAIRTRASDVNVIGRTSKGVRVLSVPDGQQIVAVARIPAADGDGSEEGQDEMSSGTVPTLVDARAAVAAGMPAVNEEA